MNIVNYKNIVLLIICIFLCIGAKSSKHKYSIGKGYKN